MSDTCRPSPKRHARASEAPRSPSRGASGSAGKCSEQRCSLGAGLLLPAIAVARPAVAAAVDGPAVAPRTAIDAVAASPVRRIATPVAVRLRLLRVPLVRDLAGQAGRHAG